MWSPLWAQIRELFAFQTRDMCRGVNPSLIRKRRITVPLNCTYADWAVFLKLQFFSWQTRWYSKNNGREWTGNGRFNAVSSQMYVTVASFKRRYTIKAWSMNLIKKTRNFKCFGTGVCLTLYAKVTPCGRTVNNVTVTSGSEQIRCLVWNPKVLYVVTRSPRLHPPTVPILMQMNPLHSLPPCFHVILNFDRHVTLLAWYFVKWISDF